MPLSAMCSVFAPPSICSLSDSEGAGPLSLAQRLSGMGLDICWPGMASLTRCSRAAVRGVSDWGRLLGGRELPSLILRSSMEEARESMVARGPTEPSLDLRDPLDCCISSSVTLSAHAAGFKASAEVNLLGTLAQLCEVAKGYTNLIAEIACLLS